MRLTFSGAKNSWTGTVPALTPKKRSVSSWLPRRAARSRRVCFSLGHLDLDRGDYEAATSHFAESLDIFAELGYQYGISYDLERLADAAVAAGALEHGLRLAGAAALLRETTGIAAAAEFRARHERRLSHARSALREEAAGAAWEEGRSLTLDEAVSYALGATAKRKTPTP